MKSAGSNPLGHVGYWAAAAVIVVLGWGMYHASHNTEVSTRWVDHTFEALALATGVNEALGRAEAANRGYLLYGQQDYLPDRQTALAQAERQLGELRLLTQDNPAQQKRVGHLGELLQERAALMRETEAERRAGNSAEAARGLTGQGRELTARAYSLVDEIRADELQLLAARRDEQLESYRTENLLLATFIIIGLAVLIPAYLGFIRESRARARAEGNLRDLAESLPGAVFQYRSYPEGDDRYDFVTTSAGEVRGVGPQEALRNPQAMLDSIVETDRAHFRAAIEAGESSLSPIEVDYRVKGASGEVRWIRTTAAPRRSDDGGIIWSGHWGDVTEKMQLARELRESREAAEQANRAKSTFLATMSHEIRTPMNGVLGMLELLSHTRMDPEQRATLAVIRESAVSLLRIIDDILDFSKIEAGKLDLRPEPASASHLVERVRNFYAGNASSKGIALECSVDERISPALSFDPVRLQQILGNFVSNAIKFTSEGKIHIRAELADRLDGEDVVRFCVADTGIGISEEEKSRLFEPFTQAREHAASRPGGTGLGLSICKRLATLMGGAIDMQSEPGRGTTMILTLRLPVATQPVPAPEPQARREAATFDSVRAMTDDVRLARGGTRILVADDHPINRMVLQRQVEALGYAAETAENGVDAFEKWEAGGFAALVTDCNMPGMDGYQLTRRIREAEAANRLGRTMIIACTANAIAGEAEKCLVAGMDDYLAKPVELFRLERKLAQWLPQSNPDSPIDGSFISQLSGGDPALESEVVRRFQGCHLEDAGLLRRAADESDFDSLVRASHRIKGASRTIGAMALASVCERIERAGRTRDPATIAVEMPRFDQEDQRLDAYFKGRFN